jgi:hypothetical protein
LHKRLEPVEKNQHGESAATVKGMFLRRPADA